MFAAVWPYVVATLAGIGLALIVLRCITLVFPVTLASQVEADALADERYDGRVRQAERDAEQLRRIAADLARRQAS